MKIEINNDEINDAIKDYVISQGIDISNSDVVVEFVAGRKKGNSATITIAPKGTIDTSDQNSIEETEESEEDSLATEAGSLFSNA